MSMNFVPLYDKVVVKRLEPEEKTAGGILLPDSAKEKPIKGRVVALGRGKVSDNGEISPLSVKVGDTILFTKWGGTEVTIDNEEYLIMKESDIIGIYN